jgi:hypothetical protein
MRKLQLHNAAANTMYAMQNGLALALDSGPAAGSP